ncbi:hypothetical protein M5W83_02000 [Paenibacillus thiaminolyticus]|uniref:DUF4825 domain-containing protein n=2 Tax=Paenibacillus thiaminolyticus TaxID=49283 RepID=A0ABT4FP62_PANTH|nr:DUF6544 family protein [Paenibacillus thiaminolyticus]MCY9535459.1 hypothetical protein [Paenibacillus thiaminolyticus]MCY9602190.1 hypothetical protein [Paenibacillus thiaminolyticus]MCY9605950.1 hypothetical protein [Paenibacillus thiaminolyticus]MCY9612357.1 hypothetical protein [Paenibacillus thiaminolyticus]MCY9619352.1 hypothetical protein [Paenibacillus thiaminolyticus]
MIMLKGVKKFMWVIATILAVIVIGIIIFFNIPYSKTRAEFDQTLAEKIGNSNPSEAVFTYDEIETLPIPVKRYFEYSGYIGTPKMTYMKAVFKDVDFILSPDQPGLTIDYTQYNFVSVPERIAFIDTSMYGIPFQGFDSYVNGVGSMKGVIAKGITLFDQRGEEMDKACLVTFLAESIVMPSAALQNYITWEAIDDTHTRATISYYGISASGVFTFSENGEALSFTTNDRTLVSTDGTKQQVAWSAMFGNYQTINGIKQPTHLQAVWHYKHGDLIYFDSNHFEIEYR